MDGTNSRIVHLKDAGLYTSRTVPKQTEGKEKNPHSREIKEYLRGLDVWTHTRQDQDLSHSSFLVMKWHSTLNNENVRSNRTRFNSLMLFWKCEHFFSRYKSNTLLLENMNLIKQSNVWQPGRQGVSCSKSMCTYK